MSENSKPESQSDRDIPVLRATPGGWLANSPGDFPRIGVIAPTKDQATEDYRTTRAAWRAWRALPDPAAQAE